MTFQRTSALLILVACSGSRPADLSPSRTASTQFDQALKYERGHNVRRDFPKAGELYDQLCHQGDGDLRACSKLVEIAVRLETIGDLTRTRLRMCDRGDKFACMIKLRGGAEELSSLHAAGIDLDTLPRECAAGDVSACQFILAAAGLASLVSSSNGATATSIDVARVSLRADEDLVLDGTAEACTFLLQGICDPKGKREEHDWSACFDERVADYKKIMGQVPAEASLEIDMGRACYRGLTHACDAGSVAACEPLTGRRISSCDRCAAGDKRACGFSDVGENCNVAAPATAPERAERVPVSKECMENPLAKGC